MRSVPEKIGKYEVLAEVGRGGMGIVYRARDPILERVVALKTISAEVVAEPGMRERFLREARSAARLQHPNIVTVFEFGEVDGAPFIAMEFLEGEDLAVAVERGRLADLDQRLEVVVQLCDGLAYAHRHGVVHRDVKPSNVSVLKGGTIKIVDFGIARLEGGTLATRTGEVLGTPSYMAPEQFAGDPVDHRADQWSVGVILYELLAGHRPFGGRSVPSLIYDIVHSPPRKLDPVTRHIPPRLVEIVERAMAKDPGRRFPDLDSLARALREVRGEAATTLSLSGRPAGRTTDTVPNRVEAAVAPATAPTVVAPPTALGPMPATALRTPTTRPVSFLEDGGFGEARRVQAMLVSADESMLFAGGTDGSVRLWDLATRTKLDTLRNRMHLRTGTGSTTTTLALSADGTLLASGHLDGAIYLWEVATGLELDARLSHEGPVGGLAFPPGDAVLVSGGADATVKYWDLAAARARDARRELRRQPDAVTCLTLAKTGRVAITGHVNKSLRVHDTADHRLVATLHGHRAPLSALAVSPAGDLVASGARDGAVRVHHVDSRDVRDAHQEHTRAVAGLAFFPDGRRVASVAMDSNVVIADLAEPDLFYALTGAADEAFAAVWVSGDGRRMICAGADGRFHVWLCPG
ncbi:MAG: serine/threonine protein kinase [Acidobacteria bacterium]|nr:serine/threonine protein kinase [Acidobacteriota bacterium]